MSGNRAPGRSKVPESGVLRACLDLLAAEKIWHRRWNTGAVKTGKRFFRFGKSGDADILASPAIYCGSRCCPVPADPDDRVLWEQRHCQRLTTKFLWIECKSDLGRQTDEQVIFQSEVEKAGHAYLLVRDVDTLRDWLKEHGIGRAFRNG